ncbi:MAG: DHH family phosphoesterase [Candidatus Taylorbacteria bacterium]|nr:DHH family phosphoesterase [Candidatus Taylorbacteria bacterium]
MNEPSEISPIIKEKAPEILAEIKKAKSILLHCHPSPDPDSVGSALAMKFALEQMGKKATVIRGDSEIPRGYKNFPGLNEIVPKRFDEISLGDYDLFVSLDSANESQVSRYDTPKFPLKIITIVIDHHPTNKGYGDINLVEPSCSSLCQILYELFELWKINLTKEIATNLFIGIYTDTGSFKYQQTTHKTLSIAAHLTEIVPDYHGLIADIENSNTPKFMTYDGIALSSIETFFNDKLAISCVPWESLKDKNIPENDIRASEVASFMRTVPEWGVVIAIVQTNTSCIRLSSRTVHPEIYDVSKLMECVGGGGHKAAAAAVVNGKSFGEVKELVVVRAKELYNL